MVFRDILLIYVDVDTQKNPIKNTAVETWAIENQHIKNFIIHFFTYILYFFLYTYFFFFESGQPLNLKMPALYSKYTVSSQTNTEKLSLVSRKMTIYRV